ncbi:outer membrane protein [Bradyrhizobium neotropicale]|uniref:outer membrane protein n=1 Tax=Bradyrhizobium neotropicale TaxID=1497615 RepID=UPI001AD62CB9|nr:outer membrane beta-barrel protein [Bradyrhizobium neotropicale]MBO4226936.1 outer membrane beta-barrel protein [Bradyrhizobium neotropicale]
MRCVKSLFAAGAVSLISSVAFAADMPIAPPPAYGPPPVEDFGGWYLRGDIGFSNQSVKEVRNGNNALYTPLLSLNQQTGFDTGGIFGVGVGYQFNNWFRADITGQYRGRTNFHGQDLATFPIGGGVVGAGVDNYTASKSEWLVLANAYVDLGTWWCVTPFIGAGVGAARVTVSNFTDQGLADISPNVIGPGFALANSASKWNFAWAAHAGLAYKVSPNLTLEVAYSYVDLGSGLTGPVTTFQGFTTNNPMNFRDITSHDLKLGVRWNLDSPQPVYAPPPLVRKG